jgi:small redox-active disulfide protein 2
MQANKNDIQSNRLLSLHITQLIKEISMLTVKILGPGCPNCKKVEVVARQAAANMSMEAEFVKVSDYSEIMKYPILSTPGLVINEKLVCAGRIPTPAEVSTWLADAMS